MILNIMVLDSSWNHGKTGTSDRPKEGIGNYSGFYYEGPRGFVGLEGLSLGL